jgi:hypothetical protein
MEQIKKGWWKMNKREKDQLRIDDIIRSIDAERDYRLTEVADMFGIVPTTVANYIKRGRLKARKVFGRVYVKGDSLLMYIAQNNA